VILPACGASSRVIVAVVSQDHQPIPHALVVVAGTHARATTDEEGNARLAGLRPGTYAVTASARGYYSATAQRRLAAQGTATPLELRYELPPGTYVWNIGPAGEFWDIATVTRSSITATEFDWTCRRDPTTGKQVGGWVKFAGAPPYAIAPDTMAPEWVRRSFRGGVPPTPHAGCRPL